MRTTYILDTSALITDPYAYKAFSHSDIIIPITVLSELDKLKKQNDYAGKNARVAIKLLDQISSLGDIGKGVIWEDDTFIKIDIKYYDFSDPLYKNLGEKDYGDTTILACALNNYLNHPTKDVVFVSNDINLRIKAKSRGIRAIGHSNERYSLSDLFSGTQVIKDEYLGIELQKQGFLKSKDYGLELLPNEFVSFEDEHGNNIAMARQNKNGELRLVKKHYPWSISPKNKEQVYAIDLIMDPTIDLVTFIGKAGTGKSLVTLAAAMELVLNRNDYDKFVIYRPIQPVGNDIGYLPGPQPLDAKIATPNGWVTMGDIEPDDFIIGSDGKAKKVLKIFPKGEKEIFKVKFSDGSETECCEDHLWYTTTLKESQRGDKKGSVKSLKEIRESLKVYKAKTNNHKIDMVKPVEFKEKDMIIDPYIMGVLLGDGTVTEKYSAYFVSSDSQIASNCNKVLPENMICKVKNKVKNSYSYSFIRKENENRLARKENLFNKEILRLDLLGKKSRTKFIPEEYKINSIKNRLSILQGLMDTDGFVSADGSDVNYTSTSNQLALDVQFLVQSLGGIAKINKKTSYYIDDNNDEKELNSNVVSISLPKGMCPFRLDRKISRFKSRKYDLSRMIVDVLPAGKKETKCILVDSEDHLYATDNFILTHNTMEEKLGPWFQAILDNMETLLTSKSKGKKNPLEWRKNLEMFQSKGQIEMEAITYIRGRSIPNAIIMVDECFPRNQNIVVENGKKRIGVLYDMWKSGKELPLVKTYNEKTKCFEFKKITYAWNRGTKPLVKITCGNREVKCTENHPFLTENGWKKTSELVCGDIIKTSPGKNHQVLSSLNEDQLQIAIGSFLGDGYVSNHRLNRYRVKVIHSINQSDYCSWKANMFNVSTRHIEKNGYCQKPATTFSSKMFASSNPFPKTKTNCPQWILNKLDARGLAVWFMDDGSVNPGFNGARISTCSFDEDTQIRMVDKLKSMGIDCSYAFYKAKGKKQEGYYYINLKKEGYRKLCELIAPYTHENISYKVYGSESAAKYNWNNSFNECGLTVIDKIEYLDEQQEVYDLEVEDNHNFIVCSQGDSLGGLIAHNCQNLSKDEIKTILTRAGENTKIILTGDIEQIDNSSLDATNNGLTYVIEKFKEHDMAGHVTFVQGERSRLATKAAEIL